MIRRWLALPLLTACAGGVEDPGTTSDDCVVGLQAGECPDDFTLPDHTGADHSLAQHSGQRILVIGSSAW